MLEVRANSAVGSRVVSVLTYKWKGEHLDCSWSSEVMKLLSHGVGFI